MEIVYERIEHHLSSSLLLERYFSWAPLQCKHKRDWLLIQPTCTRKRKRNIPLYSFITSAFTLRLRVYDPITGRWDTWAPPPFLKEFHYICAALENTNRILISPLTERGEPFLDGKTRFLVWPKPSILENFVWALHLPQMPFKIWWRKGFSGGQQIALDNRWCNVACLLFGRQQMAFRKS